MVQTSPLLPNEPAPTAEELDLKRRLTNFLHLRIPNLDTVEVDVRHGTAVLRGAVTSPSQRWRCVDCSRHVAGVLEVVDRLEIESADNRAYEA